MVALHYPTHDLPPLAWPRPPGPARRRARRPPPSVYRRRRLTAAALFLGALLAGGEALGALGGGPLTASEAGSPATTLVVRPVSRITHVVAPGETLWSIARKAQPSGDIRPLVDAIVAERGSRPLEVGERIALPRATTTGAGQTGR